MLFIRDIVESNESLEDQDRSLTEQELINDHPLAMVDGQMMALLAGANFPDQAVSAGAAALESVFDNLEYREISQDLADALEQLAGTFIEVNRTDFDSARPPQKVRLLRSQISTAVVAASTESLTPSNETIGWDTYTYRFRSTSNKIADIRSRMTAIKSGLHTSGNVADIRKFNLMWLTRFITIDGNSKYDIHFEFSRQAKLMAELKHAAVDEVKETLKATLGVISKVNSVDEAEAASNKLVALKCPRDKVEHLLGSRGEALFGNYTLSIQRGGGWSSSGKVESTFEKSAMFYHQHNSDESLRWGKLAHFLLWLFLPSMAPLSVGLATVPLSMAIKSFALKNFEGVVTRRELNQHSVESMFSELESLVKFTESMVHDHNIGEIDALVKQIQEKSSELSSRGIRIRNLALVEKSLRDLYGSASSHVLFHCLYMMNNITTILEKIAGRW